MFPTNKKRTDIRLVVLCVCYFVYMCMLLDVCVGGGVRIEEQSDMSSIPDCV